MRSDAILPNALRETVAPLADREEAFDPLFERIGDAPVVLLGEASHGTQEFYEARARITRRLIDERGFNAVCWEADWPDAARVHRYVLGGSRDPDADAALAGFRRFPVWMWRNEVVRDFVDWLAMRNARRPAEARAGIFGLDLYALRQSVEAVLEYLSEVDPAAAEAAMERYGCLDQVRADTGDYALAVLHGRLEACEPEVVRALVDLLESRDRYTAAGPAAEDAFFFAVQNARLVRNAEAYYRKLYRSGAHTWNLRDRHMAETFDELVEHLESRGQKPKVVVWAHNSHLGDARATQMAAAGEVNLGQLLTQTYGDDVVRVGFTTYEGTVTAAEEWGEPPRAFTINPGLPGSVEELFHELGAGNFLLDLSRLGEAGSAMSERRLQRAIGVVYKPDTERWSHYFDVELPRQFDVVLHFDHTTALRPLETGSYWRPDEVPEAFPSGL